MKDLLSPFGKFNVKESLGGFHLCKSILLTVDFAGIVKLQHEGDWDTLDKMMADAAMQL